MAVRGLIGLVCLAFIALGIAAWLGGPPGARHGATVIARIVKEKVAAASCSSPGPSPAAIDNARTLHNEPLTPFGVQETGWAVYAPLIAHEIETGCPPETPGFATAFARWEVAHGRPATGRVDAATLSALGTVWLLRRPFVLAMKFGCPASPAESALAKADPTESYGGKTILARPGALDAYRKMRTAALQDLGGAPDLLRIASAFRGPEEEAAKCADGGCGGPARAHCSAHRTGLAFDFDLGARPGGQRFSTANEDRLYLAGTPAYRWLVAHAGRYGFAPYPYEPWHWEWTGEAV